MKGVLVMIKLRCILSMAFGIIWTSGAMSAECARKTVAQCADTLAQQVYDLQKKNDDLHKALNAQEKSFDENLDEMKKLIVSVDKRVDSLSSETVLIRPGGEGCLLTRFNEIPPGYPTAGAFAIGMAKAGQEFPGSGVIPFQIGVEMNRSFWYTHGYIVCAK